MSEPHRIRLHGPWEIRPHEPGMAAGRMTIPAKLRDGGWPGYKGPISLIRRFGRPSNLGTNDIVRLAFASVAGAAEILLNGEKLGTMIAAGQFDVTVRLKERNEIEVVIQADDDQSGITGEVALEIVSG
ncbi:MAG TPA: hypothetical protein VHR66_08670 [Gemmataceae bacterium]|nr:hypothetical protein [Gemmataceae bacterium]